MGKGEKNYSPVNREKMAKVQNMELHTVPDVHRLSLCKKYCFGLPFSGEVQQNLWDLICEAFENRDMLKAKIGVNPDPSPPNKLKKLAMDLAMDSVIRMDNSTIEAKINSYFDLTPAGVNRSARIDRSLDRKFEEFSNKLNLADQRASQIFELFENGKITDFSLLPPINVFTLLAVVARTDDRTRSMAESIQQLFRSQAARHAANEKHEKNGNRAKQDAIRLAWASGNFKSRDVCAEQECAALGMSFSAARKALRNTPDPA